jgi:beta-lactam-binding protein with PASTA domain/glutamine amidotransferase PdxT
VNGPLNELRDRFDNTEGLSGTDFNDQLRGDDRTSADLIDDGLTGVQNGHVLTSAGIGRISGLARILPAGATSFSGGNIILGGSGSDLIEGRGGDDIIDGDAWLNVQLEAPDLVNGGTRRVDSLHQLRTDVFAGRINPNQISFVRQILVRNVNADDVDVAAFSGPDTEYTITQNDDGSVTVSHDGGAGADGVDILRNIERLMFADGLEVALPAGISSQMRSQAPGVTGETREAAASAIAAAGLTLGAVTFANDASVPAGRVISQSPAASADVPTLSEVALVISLGPANVLVPGLLGLPQGEAEQAIADAGLSVGPFSTGFSNTIAPGNVMGQSPDAGSSVPPGTAVSLVISEGASDVQMPGLVQLTEAEAVAQIEAAGLQVGAVTREYSDSVPSGVVMSQDPAAESSVPLGTEVSLVVSLGPAPVAVPDVVGLTMAQARLALTAKNLSVALPVGGEFSETIPRNVVIRQDPEPGTSLPAGSSVALVRSLGPATTEPGEASLVAIEDAHVRGGAANSESNFGTQTPLQVRAGTGGQIRESYLKFDLSPVTTIASAVLRVTARLQIGTATSVQSNVFGVADTSWTELGLTFDNRPPVGGTPLASFVVGATTFEAYDVDLTAYLQAEKAAGRDVVSIAIINPAPADIITLIQSREAVNEANRPRLLINGGGAAVDGEAPTVSITAPADGSTQSGTITVTANASDNVGVAGVQFRIDGEPLGAEDTESPYEVAFDTTAVTNGAHVLTAVARDAAGNSTTSAAVTVTVENTVTDEEAPTVSITAPADGSTQSGTITVTANASDNVGVAGVQFRIDGEPLGVEDTESPYEVAFDTTAVTNGAHVLTAVARDAAGNSTTSAAVTVTVENTVADEEAPAVSITAPVDGSTQSGTITVTANASDNVGVAGVQFRIDGEPLGVEDTESPYEVAFDTTAVANGARALTAVARDAAGNSTTSAAVTVTVENTVADEEAPAVSITAPADGSTQSGTITVTATASDNVGVAGVQFRIDGEPLGVEDTESPYEVAFDTTAATNGAHVLTAVARDAAGNSTTSAGIGIEVSNLSTPVTVDEVVLHATMDPILGGGWTPTTDATAASGARLQNPNAGVRKPAAASASPTQYFELTFQAEAGKAYRLWLRGKALNNSYNNDSVFVQFDGSVDASGAPTWRIGTTSSTMVVLEEAATLGVQGWGWADNGYGLNVLGPVVRFAQTGPQRIRIQTREDGLGIDQVVLSAVQYLTSSPGATKNDTTILPATGPGGGTAPPNAHPTVALTAPTPGAEYTAPAAISIEAAAADPDGSVATVQFYAGAIPIGASTASPHAITWSNVPAGTYELTARATDNGGAVTTSAPVTITVAPGSGPPATVDEVVLHATVNPILGGGWTPTADVTAASGARLQNPNAGVRKPAAASASPTQYFELTFQAEAGKAYRLWLRGKALNNSYNNDSVFVQFDGSVDASSTPIWRIGTTSSTMVVLEEAATLGVQGWGWADNGYGLNVLGPVVRFAETGLQRIRIQTREDGLGIDQVVLSAVQYLTSSPGLTKNDATILPQR